MAIFTFALILVKTPKQKQQQMDELKEEITQLVYDLKDELYQQKQQQEFYQMVESISNDNEINDLLDEIEKEIALAEQQVEEEQTKQQQEQQETQQEQQETQPQETDAQISQIKDLTLIKEFEVQPATHLITSTDTTEERTTQTLEIIEEITTPDDSSKKETVVVATTAPDTDSTTKKVTQRKKKQTVNKFISSIVASESESETPNMYCQNCGTKVHSESEICPRCFNQMQPLYLCKNCHSLTCNTICENCGEKLN